MSDERLLHEMGERLRAHGIPVRVLKEGVDYVVLQIGSTDGAVMGLRVMDSFRPAFSVSYPKLVVTRNGDRHVQDVTAETVLVEGVESIAAALATHGVVRPEFE